MKIIVALTILMFPFALFAEGEINYQDLAWHQYQAGRICFEEFNESTTLQTFEECFKLQLTCKLIYEGISMDEKRKWLTEVPLVKKYMTDTGFKPLNYMTILKLISEEQSKTNIE